MVTPGEDRRRPVARGRGYTLVEVLIACVVGLVLTVALFRLFTVGVTLYARAQSRADLQAAALVALSRLAEEVRHSALGTLTAGGEGSEGVLAFRLPAQGLSWSGEVGSFNPSDDLVVYHRDAEAGTLVRQVSPRPPDGSWRAPAEELVALALGAAPEERVVARHVAGFEVEDDRTGAVRVRLHLRREIQGAWKGEAPETYEETAEITVVPCNSL